MRQIWDSFIKKEELEISPGIINHDAVRELDLNTYLVHIKDMIEMGMNQFPDAVSEHLEDVMADIYLCYIHTFEDRYPELDEIKTHLSIPENVEALQNLTYLCVHATEENWPEIEKELLDMAGSSSLGKINWNSKERKKNIEEWQKKFDEGNGILEL